MAGSRSRISTWAARLQTCTLNHRVSASPPGRPGISLGSLPHSTRLPRSRCQAAFMERPGICFGKVTQRSRAGAGVCLPGRRVVPGDTAVCKGWVCTGSLCLCESQCTCAQGSRRVQRPPCAFVHSSVSVRSGRSWAPACICVSISRPLNLGDLGRVYLGAAPLLRPCPSPPWA